MPQPPAHVVSELSIMHVGEPAERPQAGVNSTPPMDRAPLPELEGNTRDRYRRSDERRPPRRSAGRKRKGPGLDRMVLPELKQLASTLGLKGTGAMRKGQLIEAIQSAQRGQRRAAQC